MKFPELLCTTTLATVGVVVLTIPALASGGGSGANVGVGMNTTTTNVLQSGGGGGKAPAIAPGMAPGFQGNPGTSGARLQGVGFCRLRDGSVVQYQVQTSLDLASEVRSTGVSVGIPQLSLGFNNSRVNPQDPVEKIKNLHAYNEALATVGCAATSEPDIHRLKLKDSLKRVFGEVWGFLPQEAPAVAPAPAPAPAPQGHNSPPVRGMW